MAVVQPSYEDLQCRVKELDDLVHALRTGEVDTMVSEADPTHLLVLKEYGLELQRERQLAELRAMVETVPTALAILWRDGEIRLANRAFLGASGPGAATTLRQWANGLYAHERFEEELEDHLAEAHKGFDHAFSQQVTFRSHAGCELHWILSFQKLLGNIEGKPAVMLAGTDVTQQKCLIEQLSNAKGQMENFLAAAAHDLKSPLITITHNVTFARMSLGDTILDETAECLDRVKSAAKATLNLLSQLSEVSRVGHDTEPRKPHSLRELAQMAVRQLEGVLAERDAKVVVGGDLPELYCQGTKFVQVFSNLISNAVKYTPAERTPQIEMGYQPIAGVEHTFFVRDNGIGIPEECLEKVFDLFDRLSADSNTPGQGVGLTVVKRIVELHGGRVWAESVPGESSTFFFTIGQQREHDHDHDR